MWNKAVKLKHTDTIAKEMGMYYSEDYPYNDGYFAEFDEFIEAWEDEYGADEPKPRYVWGTAPMELSIDAEEIVKNACEELHETAYEQISDIEGLQNYIDEWCAKQSGTTSYCPAYKYAIEILW